MRKFLSVIVLLSLACATARATDTPITPAAAGIDTAISWTALGIPHIQAADERSLGYGIGFAYARDNLCLLADEVMTVRGERSLLLGAEGEASAQLTNIESDIFFRWLNSDAALAEFWNAQPEPAKQLLAGYAAGFNRYLRDTRPERRPQECRASAGLGPLSELDLIRLIRRLLVEGGVGRFAKALVNAAPPALAVDKTHAASLPSVDFAQAHGSNAIAVGGRRTENGRGRLLANPHFPWSGGLRFYEMHLTIPGRLDTMGAALPGFPVINIGFNRHLAWTHTVDTSAHFTLHRLQLSPRDPTRYIVDDVALPLQKTVVTVPVRAGDGARATRTHIIYESRFGPVIAAQGPLAWSETSAVALQDINRSNTRSVAQWYAVNQADSVAGLRQALRDIHGVPWVNTLAVDDRGQALYANISVAPNVPAERLAACADKPLQALGLPGLDGSRAFCDWQVDARAVQPGSVAAERMPQLQRDDYLQNSNDSAWLSNAAAPLTGFSPLISAQDRPLRLRTRYALTQLAARGEQPFSEDFLRRLVTDNRVFAADLVLDDLLAFCKTQGEAETAVRRACAALATWDGAANRGSGQGLLYFQAFMTAIESIPGVWRQPFDARDPLHTPRGIAWTTPSVAAALTQALRAAAQTVAAANVPADALWGDIQVARRGDRRIPIGGGPGFLGIYNAIESTPGPARDIVSGSSYIQLVSFDEHGPVAHGLLAFSQSSDPASPHAADQTELFSRQEWVLLPFTAEQIKTQPPVEKIRLRE